MRIDKLLSNLKYGSRNDIKKMVKNKLIEVNGETIKSSSIQVNPDTDQIYLDGIKVYYKEEVVLMLNKPKDYVCANKDGLHKTVFELIEEPYNRFDLNIAGRLDIDTVGLVILTNSGTIVHSLISPNKDVYKTYIVEVDKPFDHNLLLEDMEILDGANNPYVPLPRKVETLSPLKFKLSIKEGKFHQVKRMVQHCGSKVVNLKRVSIGDIILDESLDYGEYKEIEL